MSGKGYYVTIRRGERFAFLAGPMKSKSEAENSLPAVRELACNLDPRADFDAFGVTMLDPAFRLGLFNHYVRNDWEGSKRTERKINNQNALIC